MEASINAAFMTSRWNTIKFQSDWATCRRIDRSPYLLAHYCLITENLHRYRSQAFSV